MILVSHHDSQWPPRRLPSRLRLVRIRLTRTFRPTRRRTGAFVWPLARRLATDVLVLGLAAAAFLAIDLYV
jgi:hypothetical protein